MNRLFILLVLIGVLYALHYYQDKIFPDEDNKSITNSEGKTKYNSKKMELIEDDNVSFDNISQFSLGSLDELKKEIGKHEIKSYDLDADLGLKNKDSLFDDVDTISFDTSASNISNILG